MFINAVDAVNKRDISLDDPLAKPSRENLKPAGDPLTSYNDVLTVKGIFCLRSFLLIRQYKDGYVVCHCMVSEL